MKKMLAVLSSLLLLSLASGCAVNRATATVDNPAALTGLKAMHVSKLEADGRGIDGLIADKLRTKGYTVTNGPEKPDRIDALVTYKDKWMWDITMYMLELTITIRDPKTDFPLASGNSFHTSLTRKSPTEMVDEVIENIFKQGK
ncbi:MAG: hypothetical protein IV085_13830 [Thiobacillus sp.]|nr:hypothetical protein [Thiobacillus sp.]